MPYSTLIDVRAIVDTDVTDDEITSLIEDTDAYMDAVLPTGTLNNLIKRMLSRTYTSYVCMRKDPNSRGIGSYNERRDVTLRMLKADIDELFASLGSGGIAFTPASESLGDD